MPAVRARGGGRPGLEPRPQPWGARPMTRSDEPFAGGAREHLEKLLSEVIPQVEDGLPWPVAWRGIAGYSLAGLFALWSLWETPAFSRMASVSGSLWFPGLLDWCTGRPLAASPDVAYLSLGKREHKTPNRMMRGVLDATRGFERCFASAGWRRRSSSTPATTSASQMRVPLAALPGCCARERGAGAARRSPGRRPRQAAAS